MEMLKLRTSKWCQKVQYWSKLRIVLTPRTSLYRSPWLLTTVILTGSKRNISVGWKVLQSVQNKINVLWSKAPERLRTARMWWDCFLDQLFVRSQINKFFLFLKPKIVILFKTTNKNKEIFIYRVLKQEIITHGII